MWATISKIDKSVFGQDHFLKTNKVIFTKPRNLRIHFIAWSNKLLKQLISQGEKKV